MALKVYTQEAFPEQWAMAQNNLGATYKERIFGDRAANQEQSITHYEMALEVYTQEAFPEQWAMSHNNLGIAHRERIHGEHAENLEQAIWHFTRALEVYTRIAFPPDWAMVHNNLGNAYLYRIQGNQAENLERAIQHFEHALEVRSRNSFPELWAGTHNNLGNAYGLRIIGVRAENFEQAIENFKQALEVRSYKAYPYDWAMTNTNLGDVYLDRIYGRRTENLKQALQHYEWTLQVCSPSTFPAQTRTVAYKLGRLLIELGNWERAAKAFAIACEADNILYNAALGVEGQRTELFEAQDLYVLSAYASACAGRLNEALKSLEQGRTRQIRDAQERSRQDLARLEQCGHKDLYEQYQDLMKHWAMLSAQATTKEQANGLYVRQPAETIDQLESTQAEIRAVVSQIQKVPGFQNFLCPMQAVEILSLTSRTPLVYLAAAKPGGIALIAYHGLIYLLMLNQLSEKQLREIVLGSVDDPKLSSYLVAYNNWRKDNANQGIPQANKWAVRRSWVSAIKSTTGWLWKAGMDQIVNFLRRLGAIEVVFIPFGLLGLLPLHAAWTTDLSQPSGRLYVIDELVFRYTPSAHTLRIALANDNRSTETLLAIDNPGDGDSKLELRYSGAEVSAAASHFPSKATKRLLGEDASIERVLEELPNYKVLHFSTHGLAIPGSPDESFLLLAKISSD